MAIRCAVVALFVAVMLLPGAVSAQWPEQEVPWLAAVESQGIEFFAYETPPSIERYDLAAKVWLETIVLEEVPTAFHADSDGLYISFGDRTSRFERDGTNEVHLATLEEASKELFSVDDILYVYDGKSMTSIDKGSGSVLDSKTYSDWLVGLSVAPDLGSVFGWDNSTIPQDIARIELLPDGILGESVADSPHHGDFRVGNRCFVFPDESVVADNSGTLYATADLRFVASLAGGFTDISFAEGLPLIVRDGVIISYTERFLRDAEYTPVHPPLKITVVGDEIVSFYEGVGGLSVEIVPLALLAARQPGAVVDPEGLEFVPDQVMMGPDNTVLLMSSKHRSVFRWSVADNAYLPTIPLLGEPEFMAYSESTRSLYVGYHEGEMTRIGFAGSVVSEEVPFATTPMSVLALAMVGGYILTCDGQLPHLKRMRTYDSTGVFRDEYRWSTFAQEFIWNEMRRRIYFLEDGVSPRDINWVELSEDGVMGEYGDSVQHSNDGMEDPLRVRPDGDLVVLGSGWFFQGYAMEKRGELGHGIDDALWLEEQLITVWWNWDVSELQRWSADFGVEASRQVDGSPIRLFAVEGGLLVVSQLYGRPHFTTWGEDLDATGIPVSITDGRSTAVNGDALEYTITVSNPSSDARTGVHVQSHLPVEFANVSWTCAASAGSTCSSGPVGGDVLDIVDFAAEGQAVYTVKASVVPSGPAGRQRARVEVWQDGGTVYWDTDTTTVGSWRLRRGNPDGRRVP